MMNLFEVAREIANRLTSIFLRDPNGHRPVYGGVEKFQSDPHWRDCVLFYEFFHGDNGAGIGASHQTGWTGIVATLIRIPGKLDGETLLKAGSEAPFETREGACTRGKGRWCSKQPRAGASGPAAAEPLRS